MAFEVSPQFQTPGHVCDFMSSLVDDFACTVLEPSPGLGNLVSSLQRHGFDVIYPAGDFWQFKNSRQIDAVVMNPPFSPMTEAYRFLYEAMEVSHEVIALVPWLTLINGEKRLQKILDFGLRSITHLPRNTFPGARVQTCIIHLRKGYKGSTTFKTYK